MSKRVISEDCSIISALERMEKGETRTLYRCDSGGVLLSVLTEGDLRRLLLQGKKLESLVSRAEIENPQKTPFIFAHIKDQDSTVYELLMEHRIEEIPLLDDDGRLKSLVSRSDYFEKIPLSNPELTGNEVEHISEALASNWIAPVGPYITLFEEKIAAQLGTDGANVVAVSSGTAAIHLILTSLNIGSGDVVLAPTFTFIATAAPIEYVGAIPVFIDCTEDTWSLCPESLKQAIIFSIDEYGKVPKALITADIYGGTSDYTVISEICDAYEITIVQDAAEAFGSSYKGEPVGLQGKFAALSFNGNKMITTSGGGAVIAPDAESARNIKYLATQAKSDETHYHHERIGFNYRLSNILAALGVAQINSLDDRVKRKIKIFENYKKICMDVGLRVSWMETMDGNVNCRWLTAGRLDDSDVYPGEIIQKLNEKGIEFRHVWKPLHMQPVFAGKTLISRHNRPLSERIFRSSVCFPSNLEITEGMQFRSVSVLTQLLQEAG